jgi:hypothetical protein
MIIIIIGAPPVKLWALPVLMRALSRMNLYPTTPVLLQRPVIVTVA